MSERDVREKIATIIAVPFAVYHPRLGLQYASLDRQKALDMAGLILSLPEIAVLADDQGLPEDDFAHISFMAYKRAQQDILNKKWRRVV